MPKMVLVGAGIAGGVIARGLAAIPTVGATLVEQLGE